MGRNAISSLFVIQFGTNIGYAIATIERLFFEVGLQLAGGDSRLVHFAYRDLSLGHPTPLPTEFRQYIAYDIYDERRQNIERLEEYVRTQHIQVVVLFDVNPTSPLYRALRGAGARLLLAYYGGPVSSVMPFWKLIIKRLRFMYSTSKVDGLIFESRAMADLAVRGRGVPERMIDVIPLGVDTDKFRPRKSDYGYSALGLPRQCKIVVYAGHMEPRKGVRVLVQAAIELLQVRKRQDVCFVLCGNVGMQSREFENLYADLDIKDKIVFAGYRSDLHELYGSCFCGVIPSTGWDSFTMGSVEMAASGLPVIASRLQGLCEAVIDGDTGFLFEPGNTMALADLLEKLLDDPVLAEKLGASGRRRCENELNKSGQRARFVDVIHRRLGDKEADSRS